jgi:3-hydroxyacyl-[acyl-carrier-protein] dehydratase
MALTDFYYINNLNVNELAINANISLNTTHPVYEGHFPEKPIVPGVCQVQIVKQVVEKALNQTFLMSEAREIKFLNMILPNETNQLTIHIDLTKTDDKSCKIAAQIMSNDKLFTKLKATLTATP